MRKVVLFSFVFLVVQNIFSQIYYAQYNCVQSQFTSLKGDNEKTIDPVSASILEIFANNVITTRYLMEAFSTCDHAYLRLKLLATSFPGIQPDDATEEEYLLDYKNEVLYDLTSLTYMKYEHPDTVTLISKSPNEHTVSAFILNSKDIADTAVITFDTLLPRCLTNKLILRGHKYGIRSVQTHKQRIDLTAFSLTDFDLAEKAVYARKYCVKQRKPRNHLFLK